jgi:hypothetical protein
MRTHHLATTCLLIALTLTIGAGAQQNSPAGTVSTTDEVAALRTEIERLKSIAPGQSLAMTQVAYNFSNLWFAAHAENWPLAQFYAGDTRGRLRWALRITPTRKISTGDLELAPFLDSLEKNQLTTLGETIAAKDIARFEAAYRATLDGCYACHTASEKAYLRLQVPSVPAEPLIDFAPH